MLDFKEWVETQERVDSLDTTFHCPGVCGTEEDHPGLVYGGASVVSDNNGNILAVGKDRDREVLIVTVGL